MHHAREALDAATLQLQHLEHLMPETIVKKLHNAKGEKYHAAKTAWFSDSSVIDKYDETIAIAQRSVENAMVSYQQEESIARAFVQSKIAWLTNHIARLESSQ
jgi:hypothetical protein